MTVDYSETDPVFGRPDALDGRLGTPVAAALDTGHKHYLSEQANDDDDDGGDNGGEKPGSGLLTKTRPKTKKPSMYKVLMLNDDYTPMEFVVFVLEQFFSKNREEATQIMLHVHRRGVGICGVFTYDVAETKVNQVMDLARKEQHPLQCTLEKE